MKLFTLRHSFSGDGNAEDADDLPGFTEEEKDAHLARYPNSCFIEESEDLNNERYELNQIMYAICDIEKRCKRLTLKCQELKNKIDQDKPKHDFNGFSV